MAARRQHGGAGRAKQGPRRTSGATPAEPDRADAIYSGLRRAIIEQSLMPGAKLPEDTIGETFGVSRTLVRSALTRLVGEGLVEQVRNRGSFVASPSLAEAQQVFDVRRQLEGLVVERLAGGLGAAQAKRLRAHVGAERQLLGRDGPESIRLAGEFHMLLAELTGNALLARYVAEVVSRSSLILALYSRPHSSECGANEHAGILKALIDGDGARARHLMDHHLGLVQDRALLPKDDGANRSLKDLLSPYASQNRTFNKTPADGEDD